jgi:hypothetical protein
VQAPIYGLNIFLNTGESTAKGVELTSHYHHKGLHAWINYALSEAKGFTSYPASNLWEIENRYRNGFLLGEEKAERASPLDFNQKHRGNLLLSYEFGRGASIGLQQTGIQRFNSGHNFALYDGDFLSQRSLSLGSLLSDSDPMLRQLEVARVITPWNYTFDLKIGRPLSVGKLGCKAYVYAQNLFNRKNAQQVYWRTGVTSTDGSFDNFAYAQIAKDDYGERFFVLYDLINIGHRQHYQITQGGDLFGRPREIRFGLKFDFGV